MTKSDANALEDLSPIKRALLEIRELRARVAEQEAAAGEPIAVIGLGTRMPGGVVDEESLWRVLAERVDAIREVPSDRWDAQALFHPDPERPGTMWTRFGGFLDDVAGFDAPFFGIAPREAESMDPQQRIVLEVTWETLENAGIAPDGLVGSATGVFIGAGSSDYSRLLFGARDQIDEYAGQGGALSIIAGRISYTLGLQGPAMVVDTACSASLVALHLAAQSLRRGECDLALAGGVNLILSPDAHISFTKARMMSLDGHCKTFDAAADGYGRGEGCVMVALRRLSVAQAKGDRILAVMRGSAINQDGRSSGLTAPNGPAQEAVIRAALADARLSPRDIDYVEAHGTGTVLGDPIELQALSAALGAGRAHAAALLVGSCKTNFGHLEAAAGAAGVAKVIASLRRRSVPAHLNFSQPNPLADWSSMPLAVPTRLQDWPASGRPARAGVSSFGFSGTNAHVIFEEAPESESPMPAVERPLHVLALSAREDSTLQELARRYRARLADSVPLPDLCFTANTGRAQLARRVAVRGASAAEIDAGLADWLAGAPNANVAAGAAGSAPKVGFLFTGQGAQHAGMAKTLYETSPVFREALDECRAILDPLLDRPLLEIMHGVGADCIDETLNAQPATFSVQYALARLWRSWGIEPDLVLGHSLGEYAAACVAGVLPLEDALRALVQRARLTQVLPGEGAMIVVFLDERAVRASMAEIDPGLEVAVVNGPANVVVSGDRKAIAALAARMDKEGVRTKPLRISHAFHSKFVEPAMAKYGEALAGVRFSNARCAMVSILTGELAAQDALANPAYWLRQMREPVRFAQAIRAALDQGVTHVVEIGPHPVLLGIVAESVPADAPIGWLPSLRRGTPDWTDLAESVQMLFVAGAKIRWDAFDQGYSRRRISAPLMPFHHRRYWIDRTRELARGAQSLRHAWDATRQALDRQSQQVPIGVDLSNCAARWSILERLTTAHAAAVLRGAGLFARAGERATADTVRAGLGAPDSYRHLLERWLSGLATSGSLRREGEAFVADAPLPDPGLGERIAEAQRALADDPAMWAYVERCGRMLGDVVTGRESPLETIFPGGSFDLAEHMYERSIPMRYVNNLAAGAAEAIVAARGDRPLRVLEIGAGTGGTSSSLIPVLARAPVEYWFTDVTPVFLDRARDKFAAFPGVRVGQFDLEKEPAAQGFAPGSFDLVLAANAVHATRDLREALTRIRSLLAPGGMVLLVESTAHLAWYDMTTGLIEGWQKFADDLRSDNPLLAPETWVRALREAGFDETGAWPPTGSLPANVGQHVIAAWVANAIGASATSVDAPGVQTQAERASGAKAPAEAAVLLRLRLAEILPNEQLDILRDFVRERVVRVLRLDAAEPPGRNDRLLDIGLDSLMAVQLRNQLSSGLALDKPLPATLVFDHPTIEALAAFLQSRITAPAQQAPPQGTHEVAASVDAAHVAEMSDADVEALLLSRLGDL